ncbi:MAG: ABC transporter permease subunit [Proteobacteria bacterium]|nr:ABC transporter permease subunit [Pseudomonadota bacterium]MBI3497607.1 ABC transporter permease subunit [Pseudomonadota bacterium]
MSQPDFFELVGFGPNGWGAALLLGALMTVTVAFCGLLIGSAIGTMGAWAKISGGPILRGLADAYTTVLRGVPDLLVIFVVYFGSSSVLTTLGQLFGGSGFISFPGFLAGAIAIGVTSGAQSTEVFRGAYHAVHRGEIDAARACGMPTFLRFRRIIAPLTLRHALPALGNVWLGLLKESSLLSATGVTELMRQAQVAAGSTRLPFHFFVSAAALYAILATVSGVVAQRFEMHYSRGVRRA